MVNVGVDLHKTQFTTCARTPDGQELGKYPTTDYGYEAFLREMSIWQGKGEEVRVGVESTGNTRYFRDVMEANGIGVTVVNPLKFKVVNESVKKTDKRDASVIAEFLEKDMLPESQLCSRESEQLRRLLNIRDSLVTAQVKIKNQIHGLLTAEGMEGIKRGELKSKKGRKRTLDTLEQRKSGLVVQPLFDMIENLEENVNLIEKQLRELTEGDRMVELLRTIPGCGEKTAWTIRAYTDDISRFMSPKKYAAYAGLVPWVQTSNETMRYGKITKRGPKQLRTALVQLVMGLRRMKEKTLSWRLMQRYEAMKGRKGSGKSIIATARKMATIIWHMLANDTPFSVGMMIASELTNKSESMSRAALTESDNFIEAAKLHEITEKKPRLTKVDGKTKKKTGVAGKKRKKLVMGA